MISRKGAGLGQQSETFEWCGFVKEVKDTIRLNEVKMKEQMITQTRKISSSFDEKVNIMVGQIKDIRKKINRA